MALTPRICRHGQRDKGLVPCFPHTHVCSESGNSCVAQKHNVYLGEKLFKEKSSGFVLSSGLGTSIQWRVPGQLLRFPAKRFLPICLFCFQYRVLDFILGTGIFSQHSFFHWRKIN